MARKSYEILKEQCGVQQLLNSPTDFWRTEFTKKMCGVQQSLNFQNDEKSTAQPARPEDIAHSKLKQSDIQRLQLHNSQNNYNIHVLISLIYPHPKPAKLNSANKTAEPGKFHIQIHICWCWFCCRRRRIRKQALSANN